MGLIILRFSRLSDAFCYCRKHFLERKKQRLGTRHMNLGVYSGGLYYLPHRK
jgi:hypothetical protein